MAERTRAPTTIKVCDAIMGSGKTSAAIQYMNSHSDRRFIYVTPRLSEASRITNACPGLRFAEPDGGRPAQTKLNDWKHLMHQHRNVAISHVLFTLADDVVCQLVQQYHYSLIIDEVVNVLSDSQITTRDVQTMIGNQLAQTDQNHIVQVTQDVQAGDHSSVFQSLFHYAKSHKLLLLPGGKYYNWVVTPDLLLAAQEVIIMTYKFEYSAMARLLHMHGLTYDRLYVNTDGAGRYWFTDQLLYLPAYTQHVSDMIHIVDDPKLNLIGEPRSALSKSWWEREYKHYTSVCECTGHDHKNNPVYADTAESRATLFYKAKSALYSYLRYKYKSTGAQQKLWGCYAFMDKPLRRDGLAKSYLVFNASAMNEYGNRHILAYMVNTFMPREVLRFYREIGYPGTDEEFAITNMLQWIWRSAIRNGQPVELYLPSARMRRILQNWMHECEEDYKQLYGSSIEQTQTSNQKQRRKMKNCQNTS